MKQQFINDLQETAWKRMSMIGHDCENWQAGDWLNAVLGEVGEAANIVKKHLRGDEFDFRQHLGAELADVLSYLVILCEFSGIKLERKNIAEDECIWPYQGLSNASLGCAMALNDLTYTYLIGMSTTEKDIENDKQKRGLAASLLLQRVEGLAELAGVDLTMATAEKFNQVTARIADLPASVDDLYLKFDSFKFKIENDLLYISGIMYGEEHPYISISRYDEFQFEVPRWNLLHYSNRIFEKMSIKSREELTAGQLEKELQKLPMLNKARYKIYHPQTH